MRLALVYTYKIRQTGYIKTAAHATRCASSHTDFYISTSRENADIACACIAASLSATLLSLQGSIYIQKIYARERSGCYKQYGVVRRGTSGYTMSRGDAGCTGCGGMLVDLHFIIGISCLRLKEL